MSFPTRFPTRSVAGGAVMLKTAFAIVGIGLRDCGRRWMPAFFRNQTLRRAASMQAFQVTHKIVTALIAK